MYFNLILSKKMKKILTIFSIMSMFLIISCGPSAKEIEEKRIQDSIRTADSISLMQEISDSISSDSLEINN